MTSSYQVVPNMGTLWFYPDNTIISTSVQIIDTNRELKRNVQQLLLDIAELGITTEYDEVGDLARKISMLLIE